MNHQPVGEKPPVAALPSGTTRVADDFSAIAKRLSEIKKETQDALEKR